MIIERSYSVPVTGLGRPDYSQEVHRGEVFHKLELKQDEIQKQFSVVFTPVASPWSWVQGVLASGASASFIDISTGLAMPYTIPIGYTFDALLFRYTADQISRIQLFLETFIFGEHYPPVNQVHIEQEVGLFSSVWIDPLALSPHVVEATVTNISGIDLRGAFKILGLQKLVGTEIPTEKIVRCKWCGYEEKVPFKTTSLKCPKCGKITFYVIF